MANDIGVLPALSRSNLIFQRWIATGDLVTQQYAYVQGPCYRVPFLEKANREYVVVHFNR